MAEVGTGYVPIKPDSTGFGNELESQLDKEAGPAAARSAGKMQKVMAGVFAAGAGLLAKSVIDFGGFEKQMNEVFTLLPGISGAAMDTMTDQVKAFSTEFGVLPTEVVPALYQALSAGVPKDNVFAFLETAEKLAKGGVTELTIAVDGLSSVVNAYGADILPAATASDLMFTTVKLGKTTIEELSTALFQVTPTAAGLGIAFGDVTAAIAAMTLQGVPTSVATTQLRQLFVELSKSGSATASTFEGLAGKSFRQFIAEGGNVQEALQIMEVGAGEAGISISDMFGSVEAGSAALALTGGGTEAFSTALTGMADSAGATDAAFETMNKGLGATFDRIKARLAVAFLNIGEQIAPTIGVIGEALSGFLDVFAKIPGPLQAVAILLGTVTAGLFAFAGPILKGIQLFKQLNGVFSMLAANPWVLVIAGLVLVTVLIIKNWDKVKTAIAAVWDWLRTAGKAVADFYVGIWNAASGAVSAAWGAIQTAITGVIGWIETKFYEVKAIAMSVFQGISDFISGIWNTITTVTSTAWETLKGIVTTVGGAVRDFIVGIPNAIGAAFGLLSDVITAPFRAAFGAIKTLWNATLGGFSFTVPDWIPFVGGNTFKIPSMAEGGILTSPQLFLGGEYPGATTNPEIVTPQTVMRETVMQAIESAGGKTGGNLTVNGPLIGNATIRDDRDIVTLSRELAREQDRRLRGAGRRVGGVAAP